MYSTLWTIRRCSPRSLRIRHGGYGARSWRHPRLTDDKTAWPSVGRTQGLQRPLRCRSGKRRWQSAVAVAKVACWPLPLAIWPRSYDGFTVDGANSPAPRSLAGDGVGIQNVTRARVHACEGAITAHVLHDLAGHAAPPCINQPDQQNQSDVATVWTPTRVEVRCRSDP